MLTYVRRSDYRTERIMPSPVEKKALNHPIVGYCNWSYSKKYQITEEVLVAGFQSYKRKMLPYYVRIFNETPIEVSVDFFTKKGIVKENIRYIFNKSLENSGIHLNNFVINILLAEGDSDLKGSVYSLIEFGDTIEIAYDNSGEIVAFENFIEIYREAYEMSGYFITTVNRPEVEKLLAISGRYLNYKDIYEKNISSIQK